MLHQQRHWNLLAGSSAIIAIAISALAPEAMTSARYFILMIALIIIGIPHGAIDHLVADVIYQPSNKGRFWLTFYGFYLLAVVVIGAVWILTPTIGFILFLLMTLYHFGQADMEHLKEETGSALPIALSRGLLLIVLILFSHPDAIDSIILAATGLDILSYDLFTTQGTFVMMGALIQHWLALIIFLPGFNPGANSSYYMDSLLIFALFYWCDPIIAFSIYFTLWHGLGHVEEMRSFFRAHSRNMEWAKFYKEALPFSLLSWVGLVLLYLLSIVANLTDQWIPLIFILISALTLPHMIVVEQLYRNRDQMLRQEV